MTDHGAPIAPDAAFSIRRLAPDEWATYRAIRLLALGESPDAFGSTLEAESADPEAGWRARLARPDGIKLVAEAGGEIVGTASGGPAPVEGRVGAVYGMWVAPAARGAGIAGDLLAEVEDWARDQGYKSISLGVTTTNGRAIAFYRRLGYVDTGMRRPLRDGVDLEIQVMAKPLR